MDTEAGTSEETASVWDGGAEENLWHHQKGPEEEYWHYECIGHRRRRSRAASETETNIFWTRFSYAAVEIPTHPPSWTHLRKSTTGKTKEEVDRQRKGGLQPTGVDAHWIRQSCTGSTSMVEHCTQLGLPVRKDYIFVAKALSQVSQVNKYLCVHASGPYGITCYRGAMVVFCMLWRSTWSPRLHKTDSVSAIGHAQFGGSVFHLKWQNFFVFFRCKEKVDRANIRSSNTVVLFVQLFTFLLNITVLSTTYAIVNLLIGLCLHLCNY